MRAVTEADLCARCSHLQPAEPLPPVPFYVMAGCAQETRISGVSRWPFTGWILPSEPVSVCPKFKSGVAA